MRMSGCRLLVVRTTWYENVEELLTIVEGEVADQLLKMLQMYQFDHQTEALCVTCQIPQTINHHSVPISCYVSHNDDVKEEIGQKKLQQRCKNIKQPLLMSSAAIYLHGIMEDRLA